MGGAVISDCQTYRYRLWRCLDESTLAVMSESMGHDRIVYIMLNPSTADADVDDPTIRKCTHFARELGAKRFDVVNLFGFRATDPKELTVAKDPVGLLNDHHIRESVSGASMVIAAWGTNADRVDKERAQSVVNMVLEAGHELCALRLTKHGHPGHPLYLPNTTRPAKWHRIST